MPDSLYSLIFNYICSQYDKAEQSLILSELILFSDKFIDVTATTDTTNLTYESLQETLSKINEKQAIRKVRGVYYTPKDLVDFTVINTVKHYFGLLSINNIDDLSLENIASEEFFFNTTIFDPTCGTGEFLLSALNLKFDLLDISKSISHSTIHQIVNTIYGNDINPESTLIVKLRILLFVLHQFGAKAIQGLSSTLSPNFTQHDAVVEKGRNHYHIIVGNPPYVEDTSYLKESDVVLLEKFGNIYANVLMNASAILPDKGVFAFIVPISYISTPRMEHLRQRLSEVMGCQYILSYADRPDCLFVGVHQKLCILIAQKTTTPSLFTSDYHYWYKSERPQLFTQTTLVANSFATTTFIPKLGTTTDIAIYQKVANLNAETQNTLHALLHSGTEPIYLNMRATFWMKAFISPHNGGEYKQFGCRDSEHTALAFCLLNSSLFWWYWVVVSDCWHITTKELINFCLPTQISKTALQKAQTLAIELETQLELTKKYVGTKQVEYEYKHKYCIAQIHAIDDFIHDIFGLTQAESHYIKQYQRNYRIGEEKNERH